MCPSYETIWRSLGWMTATIIWEYVICHLVNADWTNECMPVWKYTFRSEEEEYDMSCHCQPQLGHVSKGDLNNLASGLSWKSAKGSSALVAPKSLFRQSGWAGGSGCCVYVLLNINICQWYDIHPPDMANHACNHFFACCMVMASCCPW